MNDSLMFAVYLVPLGFVLFFYVRIKSRQTESAKAVMQESIESGMTEPPSLHPSIDGGRCIGSGVCVAACPEEAIGIVHGVASLVNPSVCIGHGACATACPTSAIHLVFGTEKRGMEIPLVKPDFQTNIQGLYIAGELGGMGLIRKAAEQGNQAMVSISARPKAQSGGQRMDFDVLVIGAGPAGMGASLTAQERGLRYATLEQESTLGGSVLHYPRRKIAMTAPMTLPLVGKVRFTEVSKETLLEFWEGVVTKHKLNVKFNERMTEINKIEGGFEVVTTKARYRTSAVLLAIGRRGTPRKLGVDGEDLSKVVYRLLEPDQYRNQHVLVVGGGDSAVEAALALAEVEGTTVTISYRGEAFSRIKTKNRAKLQVAVADQSLDMLLESQVKALTAKGVSLKKVDGIVEIANDATIVCAGGEVPTKLLRELGVTVESHFGAVKRRPEVMATKPARSARV